MMKGFTYPEKYLNIYYIGLVQNSVHRFMVPSDFGHHLTFPLGPQQVFLFVVLSEMSWPLLDGYLWEVQMFRSGCSKLDDPVIFPLALTSYLVYDKIPAKVKTFLSHFVFNAN